MLHGMSVNNHCNVTAGPLGRAVQNLFHHRGSAPVRRTGSGRTPEKRVPEPTFAYPACGRNTNAAGTGSTGLPTRRGARHRARAQRPWHFRRVGECVPSPPEALPRRYPREALKSGFPGSFHGPEVQDAIAASLSQFDGCPVDAGLLLDRTDPTFPNKVQHQQSSGDRHDQKGERIAKMPAKLRHVPRGYRTVEVHAV